MQTRRGIAIALCAAVLGIVLGLLFRGREQALAIEATSVEMSARRMRSPAAIVIARPAPETALSGLVIDERHAAIAGAQVCAVCAGCDPTSIEAQRCASTSEEGHFAFTDLPPMAYRVSVSAAGYAPALAEAGRPLLVEPGSSQRELEIVLRHAGVEMSGQVVDATGGPVPGAHVRLVHWQVPPLVAHAEADQEGRFVAFMPAGDVTLTASAEGYASASLFRVAPSRDIELMLVPGASIHGVVVTADDSERPVAGAEVSATAMGRAVRAAATTTKSDGSFALGGLEPANYLLSASAPGFSGNTPGLLPLALGQTVHNVKIAVARGAQVSGRVLIGAGSEPCLEGNVVLGPRAPEQLIPPSLAPGLPPADPARDARAMFNAGIGAGGAVHFDAVPPARYFAAVDCRGYQPSGANAVVEVDANDVAGLVWRVEEGLALAIRVIGPAGEPVPAAEVRVTWPAVDGELSRVALFPMGTDGKYETPATLAPGLYRIEPSRYAGDPIAVELRPGMGRVDALVRLRGDAAIAVNAAHADGAPIDGLTVVAYPVAEAPAGTDALEPAMPLVAVSKGGGVYRAGPLMRGRYRIEVTDGANPPVEAGPIDASAGQPTEVRVTLARNGQISGYAVDERGELLPDIWISVANAAALEKLDPATRQFLPPARRALTDDRGRFAISGLDPSSVFTVSGEEIDGSASSQLSAVRPGAEVRLQLLPRLAQESHSTSNLQYVDSQATN